MKGETPRLLLIATFFGCGSVRQWIAQWPGPAHVVSRLTLLAIGMVNMRHVSKLSSLPWCIFSLADSREPLEFRRLWLEDLRRTKQPCCLPAFSKDLVMGTCGDILGPILQRVLFFAGWGIKLSTAVIERLHARNRRSADSMIAKVPEVIARDTARVNCEFP